MKSVKKQTALAFLALAGLAFGGVAQAQESDFSPKKPTFKDISAKQVELQMLELEAKIQKARQPMIEAEEKVSARELQAQLELAAAAQQKNTAAAQQEEAANVSLLSVYGMEGDLTAEMKVGDMLVQSKRGMSIPGGMIVDFIGNDHVVLVSKKKSKKTGEPDFVVKSYISGSESAVVYSKGKNAAGASSMSAQPGPSGLPPLPGR